MMLQFQCLTCGGVYNDHTSDGSLYFHACPDLPPDKNRVVKPQPDKRDENVGDVPRDLRRAIIAEGKGVKCVSKPVIGEPIWITARRKLFTRQEGDEYA